MMTYLNTFCNVPTKVITYYQLHSLTHGFGLGPKKGGYTHERAAETVAGSFIRLSITHNRPLICLISQNVL